MVIQLSEERSYTSKDFETNLSLSGSFLFQFMRFCAEFSSRLLKLTGLYHCLIFKVHPPSVFRGLKQYTTAFRFCQYVFFSVFFFVTFILYARNQRNIPPFATVSAHVKKCVCGVMSVKFPHFSTFYIYKCARIRISGVSDIHKNKQIFFVETG